MSLVKKITFLIIFMFLATSVRAQGVYEARRLTDEDIQRVKEVKALLSDVDTKSLGETIRELEKSRHPHNNVLMQEAMAHAYADIVQEINVEGQQKKEWLYSMVCLNMAYLQFGGDLGRRGSTTELNRLIRRKLKEYLPPNALNQPGFVYSLG